MRNVLACLTLGVIVGLIPGCDCGGGTLGADCETAVDCDMGQICDPGTMTCQMVGGGDTSTDAPPLDGGDAGDSGGDASDGGDGAICTDADMDGVTDCAGDCDDSDPRTYPGAPETCGDMVRNDCTMGMVDEGCGGMGTFVAPPPLGDDANPGTTTSPVATIAEGMNKAMMLGVGEVYVAADTPMSMPGVYPEHIDMVEGISLIGGHESTGWTRDPAANVTRIRSTRLPGLVFPASITRTTRLDGFQVRNNPSGSGVAATITVAVGASPTIVNNDITGPSHNQGRSEAISINSVNMPPMNGGTPLIDSNQINVGSTRAGWGNDRQAFGIRAGATQMEVVNNRISLSDNVSVQFGLNAYLAPGDSVIQGNVLRGAGRTEIGWGISVTPNRDVASTVLVDSNDVDPGECERGCTGFSTGGQGPTTAGTAHTVMVTNNVFFGGSSQTSIGLAIQYEVTVPANVPEIVVHSNYISGTGTASAPGRNGASFGVLLGEHPSSQLNVGEFYNNIIDSGVGDERFAFFEQDDAIDPVLLYNNAFNLDGSGSPSMSAVYGDEGDRSGGTINSFTARNTAMEINALADLGPSASANDSMGNLVDDCSVTSPMVGGDFHLMTGSNCIDAGSATKAPAADFEGDARPSGSGHEIGPDET